MNAATVHSIPQQLAILLYFVSVGVNPKSHFDSEAFHIFLMCSTANVINQGVCSG